MAKDIKGQYFLHLIVTVMKERKRDNLPLLQIPHLKRIAVLLHLINSKNNRFK